MQLIKFWKTGQTVTVFVKDKQESTHLSPPSHCHVTLYHTLCVYSPHCSFSPSGKYFLLGFVSMFHIFLSLAILLNAISPFCPWSPLKRKDVWHMGVIFLLRSRELRLNLDFGCHCIFWNVQADLCSFKCPIMFFAVFNLQSYIFQRWFYPGTCLKFL